MANGYTIGKEVRKPKFIEIRRMTETGIDKTPYRRISTVEGMTEAIGAASCVANAIQCNVVWCWEGNAKGILQKPTKTAQEYAMLFLPNGGK